MRRLSRTVRNSPCPIAPRRRQVAHATRISPLTARCSRLADKTATATACFSWPVPALGSRRNVPIGGSHKRLTFARLRRFGSLRPQAADRSVGRPLGTVFGFIRPPTALAEFERGG